MYQKEVDELELAAFGLTKDDVAVTVEVWEENYPSFQVFNALGTQWRYSMSGVTGIDYNVIPNVFRLLGIKRTEWSQIFDDIRIMESAAITEINKQKDK